MANDVGERCEPLFFKHTQVFTHLEVGKKENNILSSLEVCLALCNVVDIKAVDVHNNLVDYNAWSANEKDTEALGLYVEKLSALDPTNWPRDAALAYIWIEVERSDQTHAVAEKLADINELGFVGVMLGRSDILAITMVRNAEHLARFVEICTRERCPFAVVGEATEELHLTLKDRHLH